MEKDKPKNVPAINFNKMIECDWCHNYSEIIYKCVCKKHVYCKHCTFYTLKGKCIDQHNIDVQKYVDVFNEKTIIENIFQNLTNTTKLKPSQILKN